MKVWVLIIEGKNFDPTPTVYKTKKLAEADLLAFVEMEWEGEMIEHDQEGRKMPKTPSLAIKRYFEVTGEEWSIHECELDL